MSEPLTYNPGVAIGLGVSAAVAIFLPVVLAVVIQRRTQVQWRWLGLGVATFIVSQGLCRLPWQIPLNSYLAPMTKQSAGVLYGWIIASSLTAGLFEETGRYLGFRFFAKADRSTRVAAMAGIGHGGIESILLVGLSLIGSLATYLMMTKGGGLPKEVPPSAVAQVVEQFRALTPGLALLGGVERVFSLCVHFSLSLMVMQCFQRAKPVWLLYAIAFHAASNLFAVLAVQIAGPIAAEGVIALFAAAALFIAWKLWPTPPAAAATTVVSPQASS